MLDGLQLKLSGKLESTTISAARSQATSTSETTGQKPTSFADLTSSQRGNFAEDFARHYYHSLGHYTLNPQGDGCSADFAVQTDDGLITVQVKLAWYKTDKDTRRLVTSATDADVKHYMNNDVEVMFIVHPEIPVGWIVPMHKARYTVVSNGTDHFASYAVTLPVYFADYEE